MSRIEELIAQYCLDGVAKIRLKELVSIQNGYAFNSKEFNNLNLGLPLVRIRDVNTGFSNTYYSGAYKSEYIVQNGDLLVGMDGDFNPIRWNHGKALLNQRVCRIIPNPEKLNKNYLFHFLFIALNQISSKIQGSTVKHLSVKDLNNYPIPVPPLEIQEEIVRILDKFTQLEAELEAELEARRQQYEYYRDSLLSLENLTNRLGKENVKILPLNDVCTKVSSGGTPKRNVSGYFDGSIPWIRSTDLDFKTIGVVEGSLTESGLDNSSAKLIPAGTVLIAMAGATVAKSGITTVEATTNQNCCALEANLKHVKPKFLFHVLCNDYEILKDKAQGTQQFLNMTRIKQHEILLPPLAEQERIVAILDKFDALVNDLSSGLPAEIAARRKQYEHYRDRLLSFKELS